MSHGTLHNLFQSTLSMRRATDGIEFTDCTMAFQSTLSMRRATGRFASHPSRWAGISIHALHEESDILDWATGTSKARISIHALHEESDCGYHRHVPDLPISIHALHEESDLSDPWCAHAFGISIHALHEESDRHTRCPI